MKIMLCLSIGAAIVWGSVGAIADFAVSDEKKRPNFEELSFKWAPARGGQAYRMADAKDQHRIVLHPDIKKGGTYPVVVGFHGQPKRGKNPRDYRFLKAVRETLVELKDSNGVEPFVMVLPVFRFYGQNWPGFDPLAFRKIIEKKLAALGIRPGKWFAFGHSGAAGCGGGGLNLAHRLMPSRVGFFDTCLGAGWQKEIAELRKQKIRTVNIHSVETAGFRPKQRPEYQASFDFGRAFGPLGLKPISCPAKHPGKKLRTLSYRCSATNDGVIRGFVVDTGEGQEAHEALLKVALRYFLLHEMGLAKR